MARYKIREHKDGTRSYAGTPVDAEGMVHRSYHKGQMEQDRRLGFGDVSVRDQNAIRRAFRRNADAPDATYQEWRVTPGEMEAIGRMKRRAMDKISRPYTGNAFDDLLKL